MKWMLPLLAVLLCGATASNYIARLSKPYFAEYITMKARDRFAGKDRYFRVYLSATEWPYYAPNFGFTEVDENDNPVEVKK